MEPVVSTFSKQMEQLSEEADRKTREAAARWKRHINAKTNRKWPPKRK